MALPGDIAALSDGDLRQRLIDLGENIGPITDSTRKVYLNKLAKLAGEQKRTRRRSATPKALFSSDDSEPEHDPGGRRRSSRMPRKSEPIPSVHRGHDLSRSAEVDTEDSATEATDLEIPYRRRSQRPGWNASDETFKKPTGPAKRRSQPQLPRSPLLSPGTDHASAGNAYQEPVWRPQRAFWSQRNNPPDSITGANASRPTGPGQGWCGLGSSDEPEFSDSDVDTNLTREGSQMGNSFISTSTPFDGTIRSMRHRLSSALGSFSSSRGETSDREPTASPKLGTSYLDSIDATYSTGTASTFTSDKFNTAKRNVFSGMSSQSSGLESTMSSGLRSSLMTPNGFERDKNLMEGEARSVFLARSKPKAKSSVWRWLSQNMSMMILGCVAIFFLSLGAFYFYKSMPFGTSMQEAAKTRFPLCTNKTVDNCISKADLEEAVMLVEPLIELLQTQKGLHVFCNGEENKSEGSMDLEQLQGALMESTSMTKENLNKRLMNVLLLVLNNPQWGIEVFGEDGEKVDDVKLAKSVEAQEPRKFYGCMFTRTIRTIVWNVVVLLIALGVLWGGYMVWRWDVRSRAAHKEEVMVYVQNILEALMTRHIENPEQPYLVVHHLRDMLVPPAKRYEKAPVWEAAVRFIEDNESRVRKEIQMVAGEECEVWRWMGPVTPGSGSVGSPKSPPGHNPMGKVWQGQAFASNPIHNPPTPCLKIRNMFDIDVECGQDWPVRIQDAILEKCEGVEIVHLAVDRNSTEGIVYAKCSSPIEAGKAYKALHGWWFDGQLVTVKYLRLERYHERFPSARTALLPMNPSNNLRLSLQANYCASPLERT